MMIEYSYCPLCSGRLEIKHLEGRERQLCGKCGWIVYRNPVPVVACLVKDGEGRLLLIKRNIEPCKGCWALPGGFIEIDETPEEAGSRELVEETGLNGKAGDMIGLFLQESVNYGSVLVAGIEYTVSDPGIILGEEAIDAGFFETDKLPEVSFSSHRKLIEGFI